MSSIIWNYCVCMWYGFSPFSHSETLRTDATILLIQIDGALDFYEYCPPFIEEELRAILKHPNLNINDQNTIKQRINCVFNGKFKY